MSNSYAAPGPRPCPCTCPRLDLEEKVVCVHVEELIHLVIVGVIYEVLPDV